MKEYNLYLDEQKSSSNNPFFCLAGIIVDRQEYENNIIPEINKIKIKYFGRTDIVFHYTDMKNNKREFEILKNSDFRNTFWQDFNQTVKNMNFTSLGAVVDYNKIRVVYDFGNAECYKLAFVRLINNYILFLKKKNGRGSVIFESLSWNENVFVQEVFFHVMNYGTDMYTVDTCKKYLSTIGFVTKKENSVGLEIADFVPNSFVRELNKSKNFHNVGKNFVDKKFSVDGDKNIGLEIIN
ncbi:DUF3800 domain-containing protein [Eubacterium sp.]|uniref:DUF3800 domain-containing protein n=1 Tax=Eubacterium sp. TaxID=142586 RepID=UPI0025F0C7BE|nr:DUF3800 domain-containing protein [Eubacterium sp.]MCR5628724.1 DUF3800 domain-containing protein [Eubacterium sp.]